MFSFFGLVAPMCVQAGGQFWNVIFAAQIGVSKSFDLCQLGIKRQFILGGNILITARKRSLRRLCFYRRLSVHRGVLHLGGCSPSRWGGSPSGGVSIPRGSPSRGGSPSGGLSIRGGSPSGQCAGGTHPTGMHSCLSIMLQD